MDKYLKNWLIKANNDLKTAQIGLAQSGEDLITDSICFHCQQAAEKFLKSFLVFKNQEFGKTHDLEFLTELCKKHDEDFYALDTGNLTDYAVSIRYPDNYFTPSTNEANQAYKIASNIKALVYSKLNTSDDMIKRSIGEISNNIPKDSPSA